MERLTQHLPVEGYPDVTCAFSDCDAGYMPGCDRCNLKPIANRLSAYEDTGLTPQEITDHKEMLKACRHVYAGLTPEQVARFRWIPVSERLPEKSQNCLCAFCDGSMAICWHNGEPYKFHPDVTHWMPLPELPKEADHE